METIITDTDKLVIAAVGRSGFVGPPSAIGNLIFKEPVGKKQGRTQQGMVLCGMKAVRNAEKKGLVMVHPHPRGFFIELTRLC